MASDATHISPPSSFDHQPGLSTAPYRSQSWYMAYMDALFEADRHRMAEKIMYAEQSILLRERGLFGSQADMPELRALANALHALRALRSCFGL